MAHPFRIRPLAVHHANMSPHFLVAVDELRPHVRFIGYNKCIKSRRSVLISLFPMQMTDSVDSGLAILQSVIIRDALIGR